MAGKINIRDQVTIIEDIGLESLQKVHQEAQEARLGIDPGEAASIAYLTQSKEGIAFCTCDKAAIRLIAYMQLEERSISVEKAVRDVGHHTRNLCPRHFEKTFKDNIKEGKALRIQFKKLI